MNKLIENYILLEKISSSEFSEVFKSRHKLTNDFFAVKVVSFEKMTANPKYQEQIANELKALKILDSPYIVKFIKFLKTKNNLYIIYDFCEDGTLQNYLEKHKILLESVALNFFSQIVEGLAVIHSNKIVHGDLKTANLLLKGNQIKIADFGFCKFPDKNPKSNNSNYFIGSPIYMAPELFENSERTEKSDMYALGVILYEMIFGMAPFEEKNLENLIFRLKNNFFLSFPREINEISIETESLLRRLLDKNPEMRYSIYELKEILSKKISGDLINLLQPKIINDVLDEKKINHEGIKNLDLFKNVEEFKTRKIFEEIKKNISGEMTTVFLKKLLDYKQKILLEANFMRNIIDLNIDMSNVEFVLNLLKKMRVDYRSLIISLDTKFGEFFSELMKIPEQNFDKNYLEEMKNEEKIKEFKYNIIEEEQRLEETLKSFQNTLNLMYINSHESNFFMVSDINNGVYDQVLFEKSLNAYLESIRDFSNELYSTCKNEALLKEVLIHGVIAIGIYKERESFVEITLEEKFNELAKMSIVNLQNIFQKKCQINTTKK